MTDEALFSTSESVFTSSVASFCWRWRRLTRHARPFASARKSALQVIMRPRHVTEVGMNPWARCLQHSSRWQARNSVPLDSDPVLAAQPLPRVIRTLRKGLGAMEVVCRRARASGSEPCPSRSRRSDSSCRSQGARQAAEVDGT